jgi:hypothetical protein
LALTRILPLLSLRLLQKLRKEWGNPRVQGLPTLACPADLRRRGPQEAACRARHFGNGSGLLLIWDSALRFACKCLARPQPCCAMLHAMQQPTHVQPSSNSSSFAGLLATLTSPRTGSADETPMWNDGELGEDVATLSYESALRTHARYHPAIHDNWRSTRGSESGADEAPVAKAARERTGAQACEMPQQAIGCELRTASVTIRLSKAECSRLRQRASEAGLTVSAYLRSCVLEADALRAQVKQALAELKTSACTVDVPAPARRPWLGWIERIRNRKG